MAELSAAGKRALKIATMRQVSHEVSRHRRRPDGKGYTQSCSCGFEAKGNRVMDVRAGIDKHLEEADPDQLIRQIVDAYTKRMDRVLKTLATREERNAFLLDCIAANLEALKQDFLLGDFVPDDRDRKKLQMVQLALDVYRGR